MKPRAALGFQPMLDLDIEPTAAMLAGTQRVFQCAQCGTVVVQSDLAPGRLGTCPACQVSHTWWEQELPVAGLRRRPEGSS